jgi:hypothetical protein
MQLDYALLADNADRSADGRLFVFRGDIEAIEARGFPAVLQCALVARMLVDPEERLEGHTYAIDCTSPEGERVRISEPQPLNAVRNKHDATRPAGSGLTVQMTLGVLSAGRLQIHLIVDEVEVKTFTLTVVAPEPNARVG